MAVVSSTSSPGVCRESVTESAVWLHAHSTRRPITRSAAWQKDDDPPRGPPRSTVGTAPRSCSSAPLGGQQERSILHICRVLLTNLTFYGTMNAIDNRSVQKAEITGDRGRDEGLR